MNKRGASRDTVEVATAVTEAGDADTATEEAATIKEEDTENTTKSLAYVGIDIRISKCQEEIEYSEVKRICSLQGWISRFLNFS